jgi:hypothetical protein
VSKETYTSVKRDLVDCNASVTVARPAVLNLSQWGSGGYPQPPEANVKDNGFPWPPPGLLGIFLFYAGLRLSRFGRRRGSERSPQGWDNSELLRLFEDSETWFRPFEIMLFLLKIPNEAEGGLNFGGGAQGEVLHTDSAVLGGSYLSALPNIAYLSARGACAARAQNTQKRPTNTQKRPTNTQKRPAEHQLERRRLRT